MVSLVLCGSYCNGYFCLGKTACQILTGGIWYLGITQISLFYDFAKRSFNYQRLPTIKPSIYITEPECTFLKMGYTLSKSPFYFFYNNFLPYIYITEQECTFF